MNLPLPQPAQLALFTAGDIDAPKRDFDYYPTPRWAVRIVLPHLPLTNGMVLEPAAGQGAIVEVLLEAGVPADRLSAVELRPEGVEAVGKLGVECAHADFLQHAAPRRPDLIITNPPFSLALEFADHAVKMAGVHGTVALLVRLGWLASQGRAEWHRRHPADIYLLPRRPSFTGDGKNDRYDYCWWVHRAQRPSQPGTWRVL